MCVCWQEFSFHWNATLIGRAAGGGRGGGLPYRPDEDVPLHELRGGAARDSRVRREAGPGGLARGGSERRAAHGRKEQGGTWMV